MGLTLFFIIGGVGLFVVLFFTWAQSLLEKNFKSLSYDLLEKNQKSFFSLASSFFEKYQAGLEGKQQEIAHLMGPLKENLARLEEETREIEKKRISAYSSLFEQIDQLTKSENILRKETSELTKALRSPNIRGSWGEMHLQRVVELAGLKAYCDFFPQQTFYTQDGKAIRPDLLVRLPENRIICIDAKTPLDAFLQAQDLLDENLKKEKMKEHAQHVRSHVKELSKKNYQEILIKQGSLEYVILFLPAESFLSAALDVDPLLMEQAASVNVILATPTTLIAILRAVAQTWKKIHFSKNTEEVLHLGKELKERIEVFLDHFYKLGQTVSESVDHYNHTLTSLKSRIAPTLKKLEQISEETSDKERIQEKLEKKLEAKTDLFSSEK